MDDIRQTYLASLEERRNDAKVIFLTDTNRRTIKQKMIFIFIYSGLFIHESVLIAWYYIESILARKIPSDRCRKAEVEGD